MNLNENFNQQEFIDWVENFLPNFNTNVQKVDIPKSAIGIKSIETIGESKIGVRVYIFETDSNPSRRKVGLATDSFSVIKNSGTANALIAYYCQESSDWRFSLLTSSPVWGDGKVIIKLSNPKRQSYVLGSKAKIKTPHQFLISKGNVVDLNDLKSRFSLEVVNKEFYKEISKLFTQLVGGIVSEKTKTVFKPLLKLPSTQDKSQVSLEFAVRLIGRIIFCWFLREKRSPAGNSLVSKDLVSLESVENTEDYYHKILEPIFFEVLNKPQKSRVQPFDNELFSQIPYLNGGLFSPQEDDFYKRYKTDFQSQYHNTLSVPNEWLKYLFEVLETYNFTIDENTSFDEELSIDPEMLGRIFENLLAEINPETGESARKSTGSYYTPRVIVDYMVDESLCLFLKDKTEIEEKKLKSLISYDLDDDLPLNDEEKDKIIKYLGEIKILDPACGSGAFPIGALQKIVFILQQVDPDARKMYELEIKQVPPELKRFIQNEFENGSFDYLRKLRIIRDCIYGIDIQPIATEISRLRCFLTLVVDQRIDDTLENRGVQPLPNLDFKFVTANSLIGLPKIDKSQGSLFDNYEKIDELKNVRDDYFSATGIEREQLKTEFATQQKRLFMDLQKEHGWVGITKSELTSKLSDWEPFTHKPTSWFDSEWMFGIKSGFDVVIANPPYIDSEGMVKNNLESLREYIVKNYNYTRGNWDIYIAFFEKGFRNLKAEGILTYISPDKWISKPFGSELRKNKYLNIFSILNAGRHVFESAKVDSVVSIFYNEKQTKSLRVFKILNGTTTFIRDYDKSKLNSPYAMDGVFSQHLSLIEKLDKFLPTNSDTTLNCENACATSDAYKLSPLIEDMIVDFDPIVSLKIINTGTIGKWSSKWGLKDMTYLGKKYSRPIVSKHLFLNEFRNSYSVKSIKPKLILKGLNLLDVCLDAKGEFIPGKSTLIISGFDEIRLKYLMAYLNSPVPIFYLKEKCPASSYNQGTTFTKDMINNLPVPQASPAETDSVVQKVDKIINLTESQDYKNNLAKIEKVKEYEKQINQIIYGLYDLLDEDIKIVEESIK